MSYNINYKSQISDNQLLEMIGHDIIKLKNSKGNKYILPVQIKSCKHLNECFELDDFKAKLDSNQFFSCSVCHQNAQQYSDLMWDIRYYANKEFHQDVDEIHVIQGLMVNKYYINKKYQDLFTKPEIKGYLQKLIKPTNQTSSFLISLINKYDIEQQDLYSICLLDFVKINIPIRIIGCQHLECYELTSLLYYQQNKQQNENSFICNFPECKQKLNISSLQTFFDGIFIDQLLLKEIKRNNPNSIIFNINQQTKTFEQKTYFPLSQTLSLYSNKFNQQMTQQQELDIKTNLEQIILLFIQNNLLLQKLELKQSLSKAMLSLSTFNLVDQITQLPILLPTRCIQCKDFNKSIDLLTYIFDFVYQKYINKQSKYLCPFCNSPQNQIMAIVNLNQYIYIDQFQLLKLLKSKNDMYEQENLKLFSSNLQGEKQNIYSTINNKQLENVYYEICSLLNINKQKYKNPALTKNCFHPFSCFEMDEALQEIQNRQQYQCPECKSYAGSPNDLVEDWRVQAYQEFNELVEKVTIIRGIMFKQYQRSKPKYLNFFTQQEYLKQFRNMFERVNNETLINSIIQKDLYQQYQNKQDKINIWCVCMLDQVKINIPVRIIGCKHYECYELTSLLFFQEQNRKKQEWFECKQSECSNRLRIAHKDYSIKQDKQTEEQDKILDIQTLFSGISVDFDLLNAIKKSIPTSLKFYYNKETEAIQEDIYIKNGKYVDPFILKFYQQHQDLQQKIGYQEFQNEIQSWMTAIMQGDLLQEDKQLGKQIAFYKYRNYQAQMKDQLTQLPIEYPVRCKYCTNLKVCMDIRSYIADFTYQRKINQTKCYICPLCKKQQTGQMFKVQISKYIYLDPNILTQMFKDMSYINGTNIFEYQGEQYMLQEFMYKLRIRREVYIASLQEKQVIFNQLFCKLYPNLRIKYPLIIQNCENKNIIDFKSFYEELKKIDFDYESKELILCKCTSCYDQPIKTLIGNIYFHEAFYEALNKFYQIKEISNDKEFAYKFGDNEQESMVIGKTVPTRNSRIFPPNNSKIRFIQPLNGKEDASNLQLLKGEDGFLDLLNDEEYQRLFSTKNIEGYTYKTKQITQNMGEIIEIKYQQNRIYVNDKEAVEEFNHNVSQVLKDYHFRLEGIIVQQKNEVFKLGKEQQQQNK